MLYYIIFIFYFILLSKKCVILVNEDLAGDETALAKWLEKR